MGSAAKPKVLENDGVSFSLEVTEPAGETRGTATGFPDASEVELQGFA